MKMRKILQMMCIMGIFLSLVGFLSLYLSLPAALLVFILSGTLWLIEYILF